MSLNRRKTIIKIWCQYYSGILYPSWVTLLLYITMWSNVFWEVVKKKKWWFSLLKEVYSPEIRRKVCSDIKISERILWLQSRVFVCLIVFCFFFSFFLFLHLRATFIKLSDLFLIVPSIFLTALDQIWTHAHMNLSFTSRDPIQAQT